LRRPLAGAVTAAGVPVASGAVSLYPRAGHSGPVASTAIDAGRYAFTTGNGPFAGPHRAVVVFVRDAAQAASFRPLRGKARPPASADSTAEADEPGRESAATPLTGEPEPRPQAEARDGATTEAAPVEPPLPPNMREFEVEVPAAEPSQLDFEIAP